MLVDLNVTEAKILADDDVIECAIAVDEGKIVKIGKLANLPKASTTTNVKGNLVLPGLIDAHVHLRDLELSYKEDFTSGTYAAAAGGFTTVLDMPNTKPLTNNPERLKEKIRTAQSKVVVNIGFYGALPIGEMARLGMVGLKLNLLNPFAELDVEDDDTLLKALKQASELGIVTAIHAEDRLTVMKLEEDLRKTGKDTPAAYLAAHTPKAETTAVERILELIKKTRVQVHFSHISAAESLPLIAKAKQEGLAVTCEATPHHLFLTEAELTHLRGIAVTDPPIRNRSNATKLWDGLEKRIIDIMASDHAPHSLEEKTRANIWEVMPGIPGLETTLPLLLTQVNQGVLSLHRLIEILSEKPANIFRLRGKGLIESGADADLTVVDLKLKFKIDASKFHSKAKYSPFDGWQVTGKPVKTFVTGQLTMENGEILAKPGSGYVLGAEYP